MEREEVAKLLMSISAAYPYFAKQQAESGKEGRDTTMNVWELSLISVKYADASRALAEHIMQNKYAPSPTEIIELAKSYQVNELDRLAEEDAKYRRTFRDWVNDGLNHGQRMQRMEQAKLREAQDAKDRGDALPPRHEGRP